MYKKLLSTVTEAPVSQSVFSTMSFYARRRGGELPGLWFVRAFEALGHSAGAVRQTLYRMERAGELESRRSGREKLYRLSSWAQAEADEGLARIFPPPAASWDGRWTLVLARFEGGEEKHRDRLYELLGAAGFGRLGRGGFVHPHDRGARIMAAAKAAGVAERVVMVRGQRQGDDDPAFVSRVWDVRSLADGYQRFLDRFGPIQARRRWTDREAFGLRFAVVLDFLEVTRRDPELPRELEPKAWPGRRARRLAAAAYRRLLPGAIRFADSIARSGSSISRSIGRAR